MAMSRIRIIIFLLALCSCASHREAFRLQLPKSDFNAPGQVRKGAPFELSVEQAGENEFKLGYNKDTLVATLDSSLHQKIFSLIESDQAENAFRFSAYFRVDKNMPIERFESLTRECRKAMIHKFKLQLDNGALLPLRQPAYDPEEPGFLDPAIKAHYPPRPHRANADSLANTENSVHIHATPGAIHVLNHYEEPITDFEAYIREHKKFFILFDFDPQCTCQDYVDLNTFVFSAYQNVRTAGNGKGNFRMMRQEYPIRMMRKR